MVKRMSVHLHLTKQSRKRQTLASTCQPNNEGYVCNLGAFIAGVRLLPI